MARDNEEEQGRPRFCFEGFTLDQARGALSNADGDLYLRPKSFAVLCHLVEHHGTLVSRDELLDAVWHNADVGDDSIAQCIVEIRRVLGDDKRRIIRTVPRRGFVFESRVIEAVCDAHGHAIAEGELSRTRLAGIASIAIVAAVTLGFWMNVRDEQGVGIAVDDPAPLPNSIAVLAFDDMSERQDQQYFGDGIAEEILTQLSAVPGLNVISRTSSFSLRDEDIDIAAIARRLGVLFVLEGSVRKTGTKMRITAQLIEADSSTHVWSKNYDLEVTTDNVIDVQNDVARNVADAVGAGTLLPDGDALRLSRTHSTEALDHHLRGMYYLRKIEIRADDRYDEALQHFDRAIAADPDWAPPYAGSGRVLHFRASRKPKSEGSIDYERSRARLLRAVQLDPTHAAAYESLAYVTHTYELDFEKAESLYEKSMALGDRTRWGYAILLGSTGRVEEAIEQYQLGLLNDPLALGMKLQLARMLKCSGRYSESIDHYTELLSEMPELTAVNSVIADMYLQIGETQRAEQLLDQFPRFESDPGLAGPIYAQLGLTAMAERALREMESDEGWMAEAYALTALRLGEKDRALDYLLQAARAEPRSLMLIQCHPELLALADEHRYQQALDIVGFPPEYRRAAAVTRGLAANE